MDMSHIDLCKYWNIRTSTYRQSVTRTNNIIAFFLKTFNENVFLFLYTTNYMLWNCVIEWKQIKVATEQQIYFFLDQYSLNLYTLKCWVKHSPLQSIHWSVGWDTQPFRIYTEALGVTLNFCVHWRFKCIHFSVQYYNIVHVQ